MANPVQFPLSPNKGNGEDPSARILDRNGASIGSIEIHGHTAAENYPMIAGIFTNSFGELARGFTANGARSRWPSVVVA